VIGIDFNNYARVYQSFCHGSVHMFTIPFCYTKKTYKNCIFATLKQNMAYKERIPDHLFNNRGDFLGRPADFDDRIVQRRIKLVRSIANFTGKNYTLLDIGCGNGASMFQLSGEMKKCVGLEISDEHQKQFNDFKSQNHIENCEYRVMDVTASRVPEQYDRIISFEVIEHLSDESGVKFYYDSLKDDGIMAITVPNKWWIFETHGAKLPLLPWNRIPFFSWLPRPLHERLSNARIYTKKRIKKLLEQYGFKIQRIDYITAPMDVLPEGRFKRWMINTFFKTDITGVPLKSTSLLVVATKS
jgi:2-polyprenyl-3-methyl-5-hydroxy-6-metoxy-1,4-benzoquinol methylase